MRTCFGAGPSKQNQKCLDDLVKMILDDPSILEMSHRSEEFLKRITKTKTILKELLDVPNDMDILFLSGGASYQFLMCAVNLLHHKAGYLITGLFSKIAYETAQKLGNCEILYDNTNHPYDLSDFPNEIKKDYDYVYVCLNNSIYGTRTPDFICDCPVVADASSILGIEPIDFKKYSLVFASAQKNFGMSGMSLVFVKRNLKFKENIVPLMSYPKQIDANSMLNTPPILSIVMCGLCAEELLKKKQTLYEENKAKAELLYSFLDQSDCFEVLAPMHRSMMNVCFKIKNALDESHLLEQLNHAGFDGIKGHRLAGYLRASLNVFVSLDEVNRLIEFLEKIEKTGF
ncbi:MAG: 3-phosphoserine/phosphohydroxythreonine transaminase [Erysipelotrichaceae bacterium]|nr:3-phosphoserine/phosphohydroxythreonine transaminase [Erysipelotrichaceae bacterium]